MTNVWVSASVWVGLRPPRHRGEAMHPAQTIAASRVLPWLPKEQAYAEEEYRKVAVGVRKHRQRIPHEAVGIKDSRTLPHAERAQLREGLSCVLTIPFRGTNQYCPASVAASLFSPDKPGIGTKS